MIGALAKDPINALCEYRPPDAFQMSVDCMQKCKTHLEQPCEVLKPELVEVPFEQVEASLGPFSLWKSPLKSVRRWKS
jgi:hypothetical protein